MNDAFPASRRPARREVLLAALATHAPDLRVTGLAAGFHAVLHLPAGVDEAGVVEEAARRGVGLYGIAPMRRGPATGPQLVLGFGNTAAREITAGIAAVADLLRGR